MKLNIGNPYSAVPWEGIDPDSRIAVWPNPTSGQTTIDLTLSTDARVEIEVFDLAGRSVSNLWRGSAAMAPRRIVWNGQDDSGRPLPPGVYFARLRAGEPEAGQRIVILR